MPLAIGASIPAAPLAAERTGQRWCQVMANPSANQNRPPRLGAYRYFACVSLVWPVQGSKEAESAAKAGQVLPAALLDKESPAGEWAPIPLQAVLSAPITPALPFARIT